MFEGDWDWGLQLDLECVTLLLNLSCLSVSGTNLKIYAGVYENMEVSDMGFGS